MTFRKLFAIALMCVFVVNRTQAQSACSNSWTSVSDTGYLNGTLTSDTTLEACQAACTANVSCIGLGWHAASTSRCWLRWSWSPLDAYSLSGLTHYALQRSCIACADPIDLVLILDASGSVLPFHWDLERTFCDTLVRSLSIGPHDVQVALIVFSDDATVEFRLTNYTSQESVRAAVNHVGGVPQATNLNAALNAMLTDVFAPGNGRRPEAKRVAVILTDGVDNTREDETLDTARACKNASIRLIVVGVAPEADLGRLLQIASTPGDFYNASNFTELATDNSLTKRILTSITCTVTPGKTALVTDVQPSCGPIAGGTKLTVSGQNLNRTSAELLLYTNAFQAAFNTQLVTSGYDILVATTPPFNGSLNVADNIVHIVVQFGDGISINTSRYFEYHDNPFVGAIFPLVHPLHGGSMLTVTGRNIDCVADAVLTISVVVSASRCNVNEFVNSTKATEARNHANCTVINSTMMICTMPAVPLSEDFIQSLVNGTVQSSSVNSSNCSALLNGDGRQQANIYISLQFDGFTYHNNLSQFTFQLCQPVIRQSSDVIEIDREQDTYIDVKGDMMLRGCLLSSYRATVGESLCVCTSLTDNQLTCQLPLDKPQKSTNDSFCDKETLALMVYVDNRRSHFTACVRYKTNGFNRDLVIGLSVGLGGGGLLIITVIIIAVCITVARKAEQTQPDYQNVTRSAENVHSYQELQLNYDCTLSAQDAMDKSVEVVS